jgi:two-component system, chemotaxis family, protein-glutamate methylesterase/glutaminase
MNNVYQPDRSYVKVLLADDALVIRNAVSRLLEAEPAIKVVGVAENFSQTVQMAASLRPDVVLLDLHMPDDHAFQPAFVKSELELSGARVLGMSLSSPEDEEVTKLLAESFGAVALLDKAEFGQVLIPAILENVSRFASVALMME